MDWSNEIEVQRRALAVWRQAAATVLSDDRPKLPVGGQLDAVRITEAVWTACGPEVFWTDRPDRLTGQPAGLHDRRESPMPPRSTPRFALYSSVLLARDLGGYAAGTEGQIVEVHGDHLAYEVELTEPFTVLTLTPDDLKPIEPC